MELAVLLLILAIFALEVLLSMSIIRTAHLRRSWAKWDSSDRLSLLFLGICALLVWCLSSIG